MLDALGITWWQATLILFAFAIAFLVAVFAAHYFIIRREYKQRRLRMQRAFLNWMDTPSHLRGQLTRQQIEDAADGF